MQCCLLTLFVDLSGWIRLWDRFPSLYEFDDLNAVLEFLCVSCEVFIMESVISMVKSSQEVRIAFAISPVSWRSKVPKQIANERHYQWLVSGDVTWNKQTVLTSEASSPFLN